MMKGPAERSRRISPMGMMVVLLIIGLVLGVGNAPVRTFISPKFGDVMLVGGVIFVVVSFAFATLIQLRTKRR